MTGGSGALLVQGNTLRLPLADETADLILVSPPYYQVRDYGLPGPEQFGLEPTPIAYLETLWAATREWVRVLKPTGTLWVNLGDKYSGFSGDKWGNGRSLNGHGRPGLHGMPTGPQRAPDLWGVPNKSLIGLPWLYALGCTGVFGALSQGLVRADLARTLLGCVSQGLPLEVAETLLDQAEALSGIDTGLRLLLRREVIWHKTTALPESTKDRPPTTHEYLFCFAKQPRYYAATDEIRIPHTMRPQRRPSGHKQRQRLGVLPAQTWSTSQRDEPGTDGHPLGKIPGSVWAVPGEPLQVPDYLVEDDRGWRFLDAPQTWRYTQLRRQESAFAGPVLVRQVTHHAAMPTELARRVILGWSPRGICLGCGQGRWPVVDRRYDPEGRSTNGPQSLERRHIPGGSAGFAVRMVGSAAICGYACACTPFTWHPGTGEPSPTAGPDGRQGERPADIGGRHRRVGPWREYHLDGWEPPPTRPAVVVDPCCGSGTVPAVARALGRAGVGVDLSWDYSRLASWRVWQSRHGDKAAARTNQEAQEALQL